MLKIEVKFEDVTGLRRDYLLRTYSAQFTRWVDGVSQTYRLSPQEIEDKLNELLGDRVFLTATYDPLRVSVSGEWSPSAQLLKTRFGSGDDSAEEDIQCGSLDVAKRLLALKIAELLPLVELNL